MTSQNFATQIRALALIVAGAFLLVGGLVSLVLRVIKEFDAGKTRHTVIFGAEYIDTSSDQDRFNSFFDTSAADVAAGVPGASTDRAYFSAARPIDLINPRHRKNYDSLHVVAVQNWTPDTGTQHQELLPTRLLAQIFLRVQKQSRVTTRLKKKFRQTKFLCAHFA